MKNSLLFLLIFLNGCCFQSKLIESNRFTEFERNIIPYDNYNELSFIDEKGIVFIASSEPREIVLQKDSPHAESCDMIEYEEVSNTLSFFSKSLDIRINLSARFDKPTFNLSVSLWDHDSLGNGKLVYTEFLQLREYKYD